MTSYDHSTLEKNRLKTKVQGFDKVTAVTQNAVNRKLTDIWKTEKSVQSLEITDDEGVVKMSSSMDAPSVQFLLSTEKYSVIFFLTFKEGWFKWYDKDAKETKQIDMKNWICAFKVDLSLKQLDKELEEKSKIAKILKDSGVGEPGEYHVMQLLIDFSTADLLKYKEDLSYMPDLEDTKKYTEAQRKSIKKTFKSRIESYLDDLVLSDEGHPHTIHNLPKLKKPENAQTPTLHLTDLTFQCYPFIKSGTTDQVPGDGHNMLCYIEMTENRKMPVSELNFSSNWVIPSSSGDNADGTVALSRRAFLENWFLKRVAVVNKSTDLRVSHCEVGVKDGSYYASWNWTHDLDENKDYNFTQVTTSGIPYWEFTHDTHKEKQDSHTKLTVDASVKNVVAFVPGLTDGKTEIVISGTTTAKLYCEWLASQKGATVWGNFEWTAKFIFSVDESGEIDVTFSSSENATSGLTPNGKGDEGTYNPEPKEYTKRTLPEVDFDATLRFMKDLFKGDWIFFFAGSDVFKFKHAMFNNEGDLLLSLYYK